MFHYFVTKYIYNGPIKKPLSSNSAKRFEKSRWFGSKVNEYFIFTLHPNRKLLFFV